MTDRELMELAAKAAGYEVEFEQCDVAHIHNGSGPQSWEKWNPLTDDGDALRLAARLKINIEFYNENVYATWSMDRGRTVAEYCDEKIENVAAKEAATRRAIVRAAAEIGKAMP